jgi:hypothetical protein
MFEADRFAAVRRAPAGRHGAIDAWRLGASLLFAALIAAETRAFGPQRMSAIAGGIAVCCALGGVALVVLATRWSRRWPVGNASYFGAIPVRRMLSRS